LAYSPRAFLQILHPDHAPSPLGWMSSLLEVIDKARFLKFAKNIVTMWVRLDEKIVERRAVQRVALRADSTRVFS
jgi:hypothetical protein